MKRRFSLFCLLVLPAPALSLGLFEGRFMTIDASGPIVATADFDEDGFQDVAAVDWYGTLAIVLCAGSREFAVTRRYLTGAGQSSMAINDFDEDGHSDILVVSDGFGLGGRIAVHLGNGDGTFRDPLNLNAGAHPFAVAVGDYSADGHLDLAITQLGEVVVWLGNGHGHFSKTFHIAAGESPQPIVAGDVDSDSRLDLVVGNYYRNTVSVFLGRGDGSFQSRLTYDGGYYPRALALQDVNGDGRLDIAVANEADGTVVILLNRGNHRFGKYVIDQRSDTSISARPALSVAFSDVDEDGRWDLLAGWSRNTLAIYFGKSDGLFGPPTDLGVAGTCCGIAATDLDADEHIDLVLPGSQVSVQWGNGDGTFGVANDYVVGASALAVVAHDFDRDGSVDLAVTHRGTEPEGPGGLALLHGRGNGTFERSGDLPAPQASRTLLAADLDRSGTQDLLVGGEQGHWIYLSDETGSFRRVGDPLPSARRAVLTDLNGDAAPDLALVGGTVRIAWGNGDGTFAAWDTLAGIDHANSGATADFDADGLADLAVAYGQWDDNEYGVENGVAIFRGTADGALMPTRVLTEWPVDELVPGDLNQDEHVDLLMMEYLPGHHGTLFRRAALLGDGRGGGVETAYERGYLPAMKLADLDLDGVADLAFLGQNSVCIRLGLGNGAFGTSTCYGTHGGPMDIAVADLDSDGRPDLALANSRSNTVSVLLSRAPSTTSILIQALEALASMGGVTLTWEVPGSRLHEIRGVRVQRGSTAEGPFEELTTTPLAPALFMTFVDANPHPESEPWYRLVVEDLAGERHATHPVLIVQAKGDPQTSLAVPYEAWPGGPIIIRYALPQPSIRFDLDIVDVRGRVVRSFSPPGVVGMRERVQLWDRRTDGGLVVAQGVYFVQLRSREARLARKFLVIHR